MTALPPFLAQDYLRLPDAERSGNGSWQCAPAHLDARRRRHHDVSVRTTLTLDPDVARLIEQEVHRLRKPMKQVVNEALRRGLTGTGPKEKEPSYRVIPHEAKLRPGLDRASLNQLVDDLEDEVLLRKATNGRK